VFDKAFSAACENNKGPILEVLRRYLTAPATVLEIGSGTGQHSVHFGAALPQVTWQTSDLPANHAGIRAWLDEAGLPNVLPPLKLDVAGGSWETGPVDAVFSANTAHIMHWPVVVAMLAGVGRLLPADGLFMLYGPFNYEGRHTSESNARFDLSLRMNDPGMGIRDFEAVRDELARAGLALEADHEMPANNRLLVFRRSGASPAAVDPD
jgi:cyclopropane fatty-acyl-phospholipid synthase-like methyltransferase